LRDWFDVKEGKATIFRPENGGYKLVGRVQMDEWPPSRRLASSQAALLIVHFRDLSDALRDAGRASIDDLRSERLEASGRDEIKPARPQVVIIGAGFAGLSAAKALARTAVDVTVIDRRNYHLFQPLLYQVATAGLSPAEIAMPIRGILRRQRNATVLLGRVTEIDRRAPQVEVGKRRIPYDMLIVATGARHTYFGPR
jgi:Pyridine nucleotide-disulphide oxidoreductase